MDNLTKHILGILGLTLVGVTIAYIFCITFIPIPKDNIQIANVCLGFLTTGAAGTVITYYFGSSKSSQSKDETISAMANQNKQ